METLAVDEGHPVLHGCLVSILLTGKGEGACLVGDGVSACVGGTLRCRKAADDVRFRNQRAILVQPQMLLRQTDLNIVIR